jgi:hypothetical protein
MEETEGLEIRIKMDPLKKEISMQVGNDDAGFVRMPPKELLDITKVMLLTAEEMVMRNKTG